MECVNNQLDILIVEDDIYSSRNLSNILANRLNQNVIGIAESVSEAISLYYSKKPNLVIIDIELGNQEEGGIELAKSLQANENIPIIFYTSKLGDKQIRKKLSKVQSYAILAKPYDQNVLEINLLKISNDRQKINEFWFTEKDGIQRRLFVRDICYIEKNNEFIKIITDKGQFKHSRTLKSFLSKIPNPTLVQVHQSYAINMKKLVGKDDANGRLEIQVGSVVHKIKFSKNYRHLLGPSYFIKTR